jgi:hypothetical protein
MATTRKSRSCGAFCYDGDMKTFTDSKTTSAPASAIWQRWAEVAKWPEQDTSLNSASIDGPFEVGSTITLKPKGSPTVKIMLIEMQAGVSFAAEGKLPLAKLRFDHNIVSSGDKTTFSVVVTISGPLSGLFGALMGAKMESNLHARMAKIVQLIEKG